MRRGPPGGIDAVLDIRRQPRRPPRALLRRDGRVCLEQLRKGSRIWRSGLGLDSRLEDKKTLPQVGKIVFSQSTGAATDHATGTLNQRAA